MVAAGREAGRIFLPEQKRPSENMKNVCEIQKKHVIFAALITINNKSNTIMTRKKFNEIAAAKFGALLGFSVEAGLINAKEGIFVSLIAEGNRYAEMTKLPNLDGTPDYDAELNETFAYVKLGIL